MPQGGFFSELSADGGCYLELDGAARGEGLKRRRQAAVSNTSRIWEGWCLERVLRGPSADAEGQGRRTQSRGLGTPPGGFPHQLGYSWDAESSQGLLILQNNGAMCS